MESCVWTLWKLPRNFVTTLRWQVLIALVCRKRKKEKRRVLCEVSGADTGDSPACSWTGRPGCLAEETEMRVPGTATARRRGQNHHRHYISSSLSLWPGCVAAAARTPSNGLDGWGWGTASWPPPSPCPPTPTPALLSYGLRWGCYYYLLLLSSSFCSEQRMFAVAVELKPSPGTIMVPYYTSLGYLLAMRSPCRTPTQTMR